ncbi:MAG TPA: 50S ribosomal protein L5 [Candidatus Saccharimonadales bacterium]|nr:50S ribosomal protein L5 [Candidatus Saccharimonadales bacterium]
MTDLQKKYKEEIIPQLQKNLGLKNPMSVPKISKIVVNMGVKDAVADKKNIERMSIIMSQITGQKAKVTKAKKAIATFKLRIGDPIGLVATLRGERMYDFFDKVVKIVLPRIKDFRGVKRTSFDKTGNYSLGLYEYSVFPEIDPGSVEKLQGMEVVIVTSAKNNQEALALLEAMGMPFTKEAESK